MTCSTWYKIVGLLWFWDRTTYTFSTEDRVLVENLYKCKGGELFTDKGWNVRSMHWYLLKKVRDIGSTARQPEPVGYMWKWTTSSKCVQMIQSSQPPDCQVLVLIIPFLPYSTPSFAAAPLAEERDLGRYDLQSESGTKPLQLLTLFTLFWAFNSKICTFIRKFILSRY